MTKITQKQKIEEYEKRLQILSNLVLFDYASHIQISQFIKTDRYKDTDLHQIATDFKKIIEHSADDFKKIAKVCGLDDEYIEETTKKLLEDFKIQK